MISVQPRQDIWVSRFALMTAVSTFLLLMLGGIVSSKGVGMAVPDWPTTFGENMFTFPFSKMTGGIFYEHSHRLMGSLVGFLTIGLTTLIWWKDERRWLKRLSIIALAAVIIQGIMGGLRVVEISRTFAVAHGAFAHAFFALTVSIAFFLSDYWKNPTGSVSNEKSGKLRKLAVITSVSVYVQLILGAIYRHTGEYLWLHLFFAFVVTTLIFKLSDLTGKVAGEFKLLKRLAIVLGALLVLQLFTGMGAYMMKLISPDPLTAPPVVVTITLIHVLTGASVFAATVVMTLGIMRYTDRSELSG